MIVEFAGLPKSGKSSAISVARDYFSRKGRRTKLITEGARACPFSNKHRVEFACWTANRAMNAVLEAKLEGNAEAIVFQDRGLFDALAFIKLLVMEGRVSEEEAGSILSYFSSRRWANLVDLVILLDVTPEVAIQRDLAARLMAPPGIITNSSTMTKLSSSYSFLIESYGDRFPVVQRIDCTEATQIDVAEEVIALIQYELTAVGLGDSLGTGGRSGYEQNP